MVAKVTVDTVSKQMVIAAVCRRFNDARIRARMESVIGTPKVLVRYVGVDLGSRDIAVAEQSLNRTRISPALEQVRCKGVTQ